MNKGKVLFGVLSIFLFLYTNSIYAKSFNETGGILIDSHTQVTEQSYIISGIDAYSLADTADVEVGLTLLLYGPLQGDRMNNYIQTANPSQSAFTISALPVENPYNVSFYNEENGLQKVIYEQINDVNGPAGEVVDWVRVDICDGDDINAIAESKALLLKPDGSIVDIDGSRPKFWSYTENMRICIRHRNHLTIVSNLENFEGEVVYDFSTSKNQAYAPNGENSMRISENGKWCMWPGYMIRNKVIDNNDKSSVDIKTNEGPFGTYLIEDVNLDGAVDNVDQSITNYSKEGNASSAVR